MRRMVDGSPLNSSPNTSVAMAGRLTRHTVARMDRLSHSRLLNRS